jgi:integrase
MFSLAYKATPKKVLQMPTFPYLKENNARQGSLEDAQFDKLVEGRELWFRALVECAATIGWRHEELKPLRVKQIGFEHMIIRLEPGTTKNKEGREAPMSNRMLQLLAACVEGKGPEDYVFTRPNGKPVRDFDYDWAKACTYAGLGNLYCNLCGGVLANSHCSECNRFRPVARHVYRGLIFHDLRRTAVRNLRRAGLPESMIMKIGGWKTTSVFHRYAIVDRRDMATAMRQFEDYQQKFGHSLGTIEASEASEIAAKKVQ